ASGRPEPTAGRGASFERSAGEHGGTAAGTQAAERDLVARGGNFAAEPQSAAPGHRQANPVPVWATSDRAQQYRSQEKTVPNAR
ncbi:hypothetical protein NPN19_23985, partial [Vibrio parahaemolyticus]|nr:hypothetical protein [Vibrio parahaemolyticus]